MALAEGTNAGRSRFQKKRRKWVKRYGKRGLRRANALFGRQSLVPTAPVLDASHFPWAHDFEAAWRDVRQEAERVLALFKHLPKFYEVSPDQARIAGEDSWLTFVLYGFGYRAEHGCRVCPETARLLDRVPGIQTAFFSILLPGANVPRHRGITRGLIRCHLGLMVPEPRERCAITIDDAPYLWEEGKTLLFDDTYPHAVSNDTDQLRVVLLFDFHRPMRPLGRLVNRAALSLMRRTAVVQDSLRVHARWEREFLGRD